MPLTCPLCSPEKVSKANNNKDSSTLGINRPYSPFLDDRFRQSPFNTRSKSSSPVEASSSAQALQGEHACIDTHTRTCTRTHTHTHTHTHAYTNTHTHTHTYACTYTYAYKYAYKYTKPARQVSLLCVC